MTIDAWTCEFYFSDPAAVMETCFVAFYAARQEWNREKESWAVPDEYLGQRQHQRTLAQIN